MSTLKAVRGTRDLLPPETALWNRIEATARAVFARYNFGEIRTPVFEDTALFARGVGEETDIVSKEMYTWEDGERFNEPRMIVEWESRNRPDNPAHTQTGRAAGRTLFTTVDAIKCHWGSARGQHGGSRFLGSNSQEAHLNLFVSGQEFPARRYPRLRKRGSLPNRTQQATFGRPMLDCGWSYQPMPLIIVGSIDTMSQLNGLKAASLTQPSL